ncbi:MAG: PGF-pre-PGF domain-containing protein [Nanoarchaeota archaeon]
MLFKKFNLLFLSVLVLISIPLISSATLTNVNITSSGINATINISNYIITFDRLDVFDNAITFYNLSYTNPNSCNAAGSSYSVYNYTDSNSISDLPAVSCAVSTTTSSGGGGGTINSVTSAQITNYISITANQPKEINITNLQIDLTKLIITTNQNVSSALLIITEIKNLSKNTTNQLPLGISYQSFEIDLTKINDTNITNVIINFKVNKTWMTEQNATQKDIVLYRLKGNSWNSLNTTFLNKDDRYYYFNALSPGFSTFTIFLNQKLCVPDTKKCFNNQTQLCSENSTWIMTEQCQNGCENGECLTNPNKSPVGFEIIVAVIVGVILIIAYALFKKIKWKVYKPYSKF